jgi:hypothetical protein
MQIMLVSYPDSLVFALVFSLIFYKIQCFMITYVDVIECSPECTGRSMVNDPLSHLGLW